MKIASIDHLFITNKNKHLHSISNVLFLIRDACVTV